jgi:signal transduction histidine kinase
LLLVVRLSVEGSIAGALLLSSAGARSWPQALVPRVRLIGEVFASLLTRQRYAKKVRKAEIETAQYRERLAHLVRVHTAGEMAAALAHEITQPLGAIENYALAARRRMGEVPPDLARVDEIDVARAVGQCVDMVKMDCELRDIRVELKPADALPSVLADEIHLQQVILNLLRNAMEAVERPHPDVSKEITIEMGLDGSDKVAVQIADRGAGIAEGDLERVFESFYSTKPDGIGVGFAICRKLVEAHGGTLWASNNPGGGAVFRFTLPVAVRGD